MALPPVQQLLPTQKNDLLRLISAMQLDPKEFQWMVMLNSSNRLGPALVHTPTNYYFLITLERDRHVCQYRPGQERPEVGPLIAPVWNDVLARCNDWLLNLVREYREPDLWAELTKQAAEERELVGATGPTGPRSGDAFTPEEQHVIARELHAIRELIVGQSELTHEQIADLDERFAARGACGDTSHST